MNNYRITYEFISHDKEGITFEELPANSTEEALERFKNEGMSEIKVLEVKELKC